MVLVHEPQHAGTADRDAVENPQVGPDLAVSFAMLGRAGKIGTDLREEVGIGGRRLRAEHMIVQLARQRERDAVFNVPERLIRTRSIVRQSL